jgi:hypothetical protein
MLQQGYSRLAEVLSAFQEVYIALQYQIEKEIRLAEHNGITRIRKIINIHAHKILFRKPKKKRKCGERGAYDKVIL